MMFTRRIFPVVMVLALVAAHAAVASACPGCKQALATADGEQSNMVNGYFWSILFMLSMPFTIFGLFAGSMYLAVRRARHTMGAPGQRGGTFSRETPWATTQQDDTSFLVSPGK